MPPQQMTPEQFAQTIKAKYPDGVASDGRKYSDIPDAELTQKVLAKYPVYQSHIISSDQAQIQEDQAKPLGTLAGEKTIDAGTAGLKKFSEGMDIATQTPMSKNPLKNAAVGLEAGLRTAAGGVETASAPIAGFISALLTKLKPADQSVTGKEVAGAGDTGFADSVKAVAAAHPELAKNLGDLFTVATAPLGVEGAGKDVAEAVSKQGLKDAASGIKESVQAIPQGFKSAKEAIAKTMPGQAPVGQKAFDDALSIARQKTTSGVESAAFNEGRVVGKQGLFKGAKMLPSKEETNMAEALQPLVEDGVLSKDMPPTLQRDIIKQKVSEINQGIKTMVKNPEYNQPFTGNQLDEALGKVSQKNRILFGGDEKAQKAYDTVIDEFKTFVKTKNVSGLLDARQSFDSYIKNNFPKAFKDFELTGEVNPRVQALRDVRTAANDFSEKLLDDAQIQKITRLTEPKQARSLMDSARTFKKPEDFVRYVNDNPEKFGKSELPSTSTRKGQATQNTENQYPTTKNADLQEIWNIANTEKISTTGDTFRSMLRKESSLITASENIGTKVKGITQQGRIAQWIKDNPKKAAALGIISTTTVGIPAISHAETFLGGGN